MKPKSTPSEAGVLAAKLKESLEQMRTSFGNGWIWPLTASTNIEEVIAALENSSSMKADVDALETLKGIIVRKEQELAEDTALPLEQYQHTSTAFLWVCQEIDKLAATINSKESGEA